MEFFEAIQYMFMGTIYLIIILILGVLIPYYLLLSIIIHIYSKKTTGKGTILAWIPFIRIILFFNISSEEKKRNKKFKEQKDQNIIEKNNKQTEIYDAANININKRSENTIAKKETEKVKKIKCPNCGTLIKEDIVICPFCGKENK